MHRNFIALAALLGGLAVATGAFGAHGLQRITADQAIIRSYQTAVLYQMFHVLGLLAIGILFEKYASPLLNWSGGLFLAGIFLFSGSIYVLTWLKINGMETRWIGPITPVGGVLFIAGWLLLMTAVLRKKS
ncbi:MAG: DUF423 domain-containing protein [Chitinophagaceae bacterium]|nr:DUF423 domain-containing protein [Chitinophagaceae bacterium]